MTGPTATVTTRSKPMTVTAALAGGAEAPLPLLLLGALRRRCKVELRC